MDTDSSVRYRDIYAGFSSSMVSENYYNDDDDDNDNQ